MAVLVPPNEVHEVPIENPHDRLTRFGYMLPEITRIYRASSRGDGILSLHEGHPVPRKGLAWPDAVEKNNEVKRLTLAMMASFAGLRKGLTGFLNQYLYNYCQLAQSIYYQSERVALLKYEFYSTTSKGAWKLLETFLVEIGIVQGVASRFGQIIATILEYDDSYRMPVVDIMSEFTKAEILKSPGNFIDKFVRILAERSDNDNLIGKFKNFSRMIRFALWIPKYRKAFRKAFESVDLALLQYDKFDEYWTLNKKGYDAKGRKLDERLADMQKQVNEYQEKRRMQTLENKWSQLV